MVVGLCRSFSVLGEGETICSERASVWSFVEDAVYNRRECGEEIDVPSQGVDEGLLVFGEHLQKVGAPSGRYPMQVRLSSSS